VSNPNVARELTVANFSMAGASDDVDRKVVLGKIVGAFGVQGWVKVESYTDPIDNILDYPVWQLSDGERWKPSKLVTGRVTSKGVQAQLESIGDRTIAERSRGVLIAVARSELPPPRAGQYYWDDLIGLDAFSPEGELLGRIEDIRATAAHALLLIAGLHDGKRVEHLVPLVSERLLSVDLSARRATVDWDRTWTD
jgi:16S rRNA processing protein RimM